MKIFVTGSSGLIGKQLTSALRNEGHQIVRLVRHPARDESERTWDTSAQTIPPTLLDGCEALIHLAGENIASGRWTTSRKDRIYHSRVDSTARFADAIARMETPPRVFVVASAIGYYGDRGDEILTEESPAGDCFLAKVCRDWEQAADPARQRTRVVHIRTGMVLSSRGGAMRSMMVPFKLGLGGVIGSGKQYWSWITLEDIVRLFVTVVDDDSYVGVVNGVTPFPVTNREFTKTFGKILSRPTVLPMPGFMAKIALGEMAEDLILASTRVMPEIAQKHGFQFTYPELKPALESLHF